MSDSHLSELAQRLVVGRKRDGRSIYDEKAKHELIMACREPGASLAKVARACGVNANQLASWVRQYERSVAQNTPLSGEVVEAQASDFVPVRIEPTEPAAAEPVVNLQARLPNGVVLDLRGCDLGQACSVIEALGRVRCSASTKG
ncbi:IS66-like element accessory protein TnpA [Azohydromonas lata]|uniref:Transposase n=1 Tax=Azohydromonas lata TaxID=45677 RepID=A0ABU5I8P1_9BURK|nr:transposase [Azohydromonas lata]MDZ5455287.1 transposase [Azohydromonas lata]